MAYNAPSSRSTGELCTASIWNADVVANEIAIYAGALSVTSQAVGDILYASSTTQFARVAAVATGQVLTSAGTGTVPAYSATPALTSVDMGGTTVYGSRAITVDTGGVLNVVLASSAGDDFTVDTTKLVVSGDSGNIGIGTATPGYTLDVQHAGNARLLNITATTGANYLYSAMVNTTGLLYWGLEGSSAAQVIGGALAYSSFVSTNSATALHLGTAGVARMTVAAAGNVGIGTTAPKSALHVTDASTHGNIHAGGSTTVLGSLFNYQSVASGYTNISMLNNSGGANARINFGFGVIASNQPTNTIMTLNQSGYVGIGTTSPVALLHVEGGFMQVGATGTSYGINAPKSLYFNCDSDNNATGEVFIWGTNRASASGGTELMRLTDGGFLGIGVDPGAFKLSITETATYAPPILLTAPHALIKMISSAGSGTCYIGMGGGYITGAAAGLLFRTEASPIYFSTTAATGIAMSITTGNNVDVTGTFTAGTKTFRIKHPLPELKDTHHLIHGCLEGPRLDLIYRGTVALVDGAATVDLDEAAGMRAGTWELLCRDSQVFTTNETGWYHVRGTVSGSTLTIECEEGTCDDTVSWLVVAERQDDEIRAQSSTDEEGHLMIESLQSEDPSASASPSA